jgi:hypothetical protein
MGSRSAASLSAANRIGSVVDGMDEMRSAIAAGLIATSNCHVAGLPTHARGFEKGSMPIGQSAERTIL